MWEFGLADPFALNPPPGMAAVVRNALTNYKVRGTALPPEGKQRKLESTRRVL